MRLEFARTLSGAASSVTQSMLRRRVCVVPWRRPDMQVLRGSDTHEWPVPLRTAAARSIQAGAEGTTDKSAVAVMTAEVLAGVTVSLSMVPLTLAISTLAGVTPLVGLQSAAVMAIVAALTGSQRACISGAAGSVAVVAGPLTGAHGVEYLYAAVIASGMLQVWLCDLPLLCQLHHTQV